MGTSSKSNIEDTIGGKGQHDVTDELKDEAVPNEVDGIFERARQTVKPIINKEETNERISEDILNFKMD